MPLATAGRRGIESKPRRNGPGRACLLAFLATLAVAAPCGQASASAPSGFIGAVFPFSKVCSDLLARSGSCLSAQDLGRMRQANVRYVRWGFRWSHVQPMKLLPPNWHETDAMIGALASRGITVLPVLTATPRWAGATIQTPPVDSARTEGDWRDFLRAAVNRYGPGGIYWTSIYPAQFPGAPARPIETWQIWNEQNLENTFPPHPSPRRYAELVRISHDAITQADPRARILLGGMPGYVRYRAWHYLDRLYDQPGMKHDFDAVALHPYAPDVRHVTKQIKRVRRVMNAHGDKGAPIWVTELGWGSDGPDKFGINQGARGQRRMLHRAFPRLERARRPWNLERVFWYDWRDPPPDSHGCSFCRSSGLFRHDGTPKPAWRAFLRVTSASG
jgi:polysaccharide biosynthesis protein PslG